MQELDQLDPSLLLDNPVYSLSAATTSTPAANATLIPTADGAYTRIVFTRSGSTGDGISTSDEYDRVCQFLSKSIRRTKEDYEGVWAKRDKNKRAYEGLPVKGEAITLPMCRSNTNQQHAWLIDTLYSRDPFMDCEALGDRKFTIVTKNPDTGIYSQQQVTAVDEAKGIRDLINYKWTHRLPMRGVLSAWCMEALQDGNLPALTKVIHDDRYYARKIVDRTTKTVKQSRQSSQPSAPSELSVPDEPGELPGEEEQDIQILNSPQFVKYQGETVRIITIPGENFLKPFSASTIEESPWVSHFFDEEVYETHRKLSLGRKHQFGGYDFCLPDGEEAPDDLISEVLLGTIPTDEQPNKRASRSVKEVNKQREISPLDTNVIHEVYFRWPILTDEEAASPAPTIEWMELCGYFHEKAQKLLSCWLLPNWSGERPFVDWFMRQRPNSYSGTCTVEDIAPFQHYASSLFHLQVQNMVMRNVSVFFVRKGSSAATSLRGRKLRPGMIVEFDDPEDIKNEQLGTAVDSVSREIQFCKASAQELSLVTQYDSGTADLSRVAGAAFSQQQDLAKMQPQQVYDNFCDAISRLALKYLQFLIQYAPEQHLPKFSDISDAVIDNVLHLPREMIMNGDFSIYPVATPRDETKQMESQRDLQLSQEISKANQFMLSMFGLVAKPGVPPPFVQMGLTAIERSEKILGELISHTRHDASEYVVPQSTLMSLIHQLYEQQQMLMQQQQMQIQQGGQPGQSGPGGPHPGGPGGGQVQPKVVISGKLTPEQEMEILRNQGITGQGQQPQQGGPHPVPPSPPQGMPPQPPPMPPQGAPSNAT